MPIVLNNINKNKIIFIEIGLIWKYIPFKSSNKLKYRVMYVILNIIQPKYILTVNWITKRDILFKVWTAKHTNSSFIVIQHGAYIGGIVTAISHNYTNCDVFLTWGTYFVDQFLKYNHKKKVQIIEFGNPIYNLFNRENYHYKNNNSNKVLLLPTLLDNVNIFLFYKLVNKLTELNFKVEVIPHQMQGINQLNSDGTMKYPKFDNINQITASLYSLLQENQYDFVISDHSTALLDAIFFKNKVIYFDPNNKIKGYTTNYSYFLDNLCEEDLSSISKDRFFELISVDKQEALFKNMIFMGNNILD